MKDLILSSFYFTPGLLFETLNRHIAIHSNHHFNIQVQSTSRGCHPEKPSIMKGQPGNHTVLVGSNLTLPCELMVRILILVKVMGDDYERQARQSHCSGWVKFDSSLRADGEDGDGVVKSDDGSQQ